MLKVFQHDALRLLVRGIRWVNVLVTVMAYTVLAPFGYTILGVLCFAWRGDVIARARRLQRITTAAYRLLFCWLRMMGIAVFDGRQALPGLPRTPCVVIANHPTLMDIAAISVAVGGGTTVVKPALFRQWTLHRLLVGAGHVEGPGTDPMSAGRVVDEAVERLRWGMSVIVFPEGTRSLRGELLRFGRLPFEIACRTNVPLVSLTVTCAPVYLSKEVPWFRPPHPTARLRLGVLAVDEPERSGSDSRVLRELVEGRYRAWMRQLALPVGPA